MKKLFIAFAAISLGLLAASCSIGDIIGINLDYDMDNPWDSWTKVKTGVYLGTEEGWNKDEVIAKGTDGSIIVCKVDGSGDLPREFSGFDGKKTVYSFGQSQYKGTKIFTHTTSIVAETQSTAMDAFTANVAATKKLWGAKGVGLITTPKKYKKIANGSDFWGNYKAICDKYQAGGYVAPENQLTTEYTEFDTKWFTDKYPKDMDAKGWVVPYTGKGKIEWMTVFRQQGWDDHGNRKVLYGGCQFELVTYVKAEITGITYDEAAEYLNKVKSSGKYNVQDKDNFADGSTSFAFKAWSNDEAENLEGFKGYIYPSYDIKFTSLLTPTLTIEFAVCYITFV